MVFEIISKQAERKTHGGVIPATRKNSQNINKWAQNPQNEKVRNPGKSKGEYKYGPGKTPRQIRRSPAHAQRPAPISTPAQRPGGPATAPPKTQADPGRRPHREARHHRQRRPEDHAQHHRPGVRRRRSPPGPSSTPSGPAPGPRKPPAQNAQKPPLETMQAQQMPLRAARSPVERFLFGICNYIPLHRNDAPRQFLPFDRRERENKRK